MIHGNQTAQTAIPQTGLSSQLSDLQSNIADLHDAISSTRSVFGSVLKADQPEAENKQLNSIQNHSNVTNHISEMNAELRRAIRYLRSINDLADF